MRMLSEVGSYRCSVESFALARSLLRSFGQQRPRERKVRCRVPIEEAMTQVFEERTVKLAPVPLPEVSHIDRSAEFKRKRRVSTSQL